MVVSAKADRERSRILQARKNKRGSDPPVSLTEGAVMTENPLIIQMNIAHYQAMLKLDMDGAKRSVIEKLLAKAKEDLALAMVESGRWKRAG